MMSENNPFIKKKPSLKLFGKQDKPSVFFSQSGMGVAPVICYESIWGSYVQNNQPARQLATLKAVYIL